MKKGREERNIKRFRKEFMHVHLRTGLREQREYLVSIENIPLEKQTLKVLFCSLIFLRERQRDTDLVFPLLMPSLVDSCVCPDWGHCHSRTTL